MTGSHMRPQSLPSCCLRPKVRNSIPKGDNGKTPGTMAGFFIEPGLLRRPWQRGGHFTEGKPKVTKPLYYPGHLVDRSTEGQLYGALGS